LQGSSGITSDGTDRQCHPLQSFGTCPGGQATQRASYFCYHVGTSGITGTTSCFDTNRYVFADSSPPARKLAASGAADSETKNES
jgi:hypothetical protein